MKQTTTLICMAALVFILEARFAVPATALPPRSAQRQASQNSMASHDGLVELYPNTTSKSSDEPSQGGHLFLQSSAWNQAAAGLGLGPDMFIKPLVSGMLPGSV